MPLPMTLPLRAAVSAALVLALAGLAACSSGRPGTAPVTAQDSQLSYDRTFDAALGAMADQKLVFSVQDRRNGRIVGTLDGESITATLEPMPDGTLRVNFVSPGETPAGTALRQRVIGSYNARMSNHSILGGFKDSGDQRGPSPCPSGPAFCP
jgi:hypothetical protein